MNWKVLSILTIAVLLKVNPILADSSRDTQGKMVAEAEELIAEDSPEDAIKILERVVQEDPNYVTAYLDLGLAYMKANDPMRAAASYRKADDLSPSIQSRLGLQWAALEMKQFKESVEFGQSVLILDPVNYYARLRIAYAHYQLKNYDQAKSEYMELSNSYGSEANSLWGAGLSSFAKGNKDEGLSLIKKAYQLDPEHEGIRKSLGLVPTIPYILATPSVSYFNYTDGSKKYTGSYVGLSGSYALNDHWIFSAGYQTVQSSASYQSSSRYNGLKGFYLTDQNLIYTSQNYSGLSPGYTYSAGGYTYESSGTLYNNGNKNLKGFSYSNPGQNSSAATYSYNYQIATGQVAYMYDDKLSFTIGGNYLQSSNSILNSAKTATVGAYYNWKNLGFIFDVSGIWYPENKGVQVSPGLRWDIYGHFHSLTVIDLQSNRINGSLVNENLLYYYNTYSLNSSLNYDQYYNLSNGTVSKSYSAATQTFYWQYPKWMFGFSYRFGSLFNPVTQFGNSIVFNPTKMGAGASLFYSYSPWENVKLSFSYSYDKWSTVYGTSPTSNIGTFSVQMRFP